MRARLLLYAFALLGIVACSQRTAGAIEFDAAGTPTVVATRTTPAATPTLPLATPTAPVATPTLPVTTPTAPVATATAPIATATRAAPTATAVPTRPVATPTRLVPTADPTEPPATPFAAPTPQVELAQQPVFAFPTAELPLGMPGPNTLVYQAFWSGAAHNQLQQSDWRGDPGWSTALGILENGGIQQPGIEFASPFLMGNARALVQSGNYAVQAQIASDNTPGSAFGVYIRRGSPAVNASSQPLTAGLWRGGVVDRTHAFILAEQFLTEQTPADLLLTKPVDSANISAAQGFVTYRLEAHDTHVWLSIDGRIVLQADDARYAVGDDIGVWADHAHIRVRDFKLYTPS